MKRVRAATLWLLLAGAGGSSATARPPSLDTLFPPGAQRGTTVQVTASGSFSTWPPRVWTDGPGIDVRPLPESGKLAVAVAPDARVGVHWLRLHDDEGATVLRPFLVGTLPEVVEAEPNDDPAAPQRLDSSAITVNGRLARTGDVDGFALPLTKGQTLVAALEANRRLGSPLDGLLQVVSPQGFVLAENDDGPDRDPLLVFQAPRDGTYLVRLFAFPAEPDARIGFAGGDAFVYRLTLTTGAYVDHVYPLAVSRGAPGRVDVVGWNIPPDSTQLDVEAASAADEFVILDHRSLANEAEVRLSPHEAAREVEPNSLEAPQEIALPITLSGRIDAPRDQDVYRFMGRKGDQWRIRVESRSLGHPLDAVLRVIDVAGKTLAEIDDPGRRRSATRDPELLFSVPADGPYRVVVRDLNHQASFRHVYRLTLAAPAPEYTLSLAADRFTLTLDQPLKIPVTMNREDGFTGDVDVEAIGLPEEITATTALSAAKGPSAKMVTLELCAHQGPWSGPLRIVGRSGGALPAVKPATAQLAGTGATTGHLWLSVVKPPEKKTPAPAAK